MTETEGLWPLCETCGAVPTSHKDYRDCVAHMQVVAQAYDAGRENGGRQERAAVVAWLRWVAGDTREWSEVADVYDTIADNIERGAHRREEEK